MQGNKKPKIGGGLGLKEEVRSEKEQRQEVRDGGGESDADPG